MSLGSKLQEKAKKLAEALKIEDSKQATDDWRNLCKGTITFKSVQDEAGAIVLNDWQQQILKDTISQFAQMMSLTWPKLPCFGNYFSIRLQR